MSCEKLEKLKSEICQLREKVTVLKTEKKRVYDAVQSLYYAAHWTPDRPCNANVLWMKVRDAVKFSVHVSPSVVSKGKDTENREFETKICQLQEELEHIKSGEFLNSEIKGLRKRLLLLEAEDKKLKSDSPSMKRLYWFDKYQEQFADIKNRDTEIRDLCEQNEKLENEIKTLRVRNTVLLDTNSVFGDSNKMLHLRNAILVKKVNKLETGRKRAVDAVNAYTAAHGAPDQSCNANVLWMKVRDAVKFPVHVSTVDGIKILKSRDSN